MLQAKTQCEIVQGNLSLEVKNEIERLFQRRDLQETLNHEFFLSSTEGSHPQNYVADQQRLQISELQFEKFLHTFNGFMLVTFKTQVSVCSSFPSEAMLWIKEVGMVDSVDDLNKILALNSGLYSFPEF